MIAQERRAQRLRTECFGDLRLRNPLWDMLLELDEADRHGRLLSVSDLCRASDAPETTALRHVGTLVRKGYAERYRDLVDLRRSWVSITDKGRRAFARYAATAAIG